MQTKKLLIYLFCSFSCVLLFQSSAKAEASKRETYDFIASKIQLRFTENGTFKSARELSASADFCTLTYDHNWSNSKGDLTESSIEVDLRTIDPDSITFSKSPAALDSIHERAGMGYVSFKTTGKKALIDFRMGDSRTLQASQAFDTLDYDDAQRVSKALRHLVTLCGGKKEMF